MKSFLCWLSVTIVIVLVGVCLDFNTNYLVISGLGLLLLSILEMVSLAVYEKSAPFKELRIFCLILIFSGLTIVQLRDILKPTFPVREVVQGVDRIDFKNEPNDPYKNIFFDAQHDVVEPDSLKIKDSFTYLANMIDYDILGKRRVFINYMFGNNEMTNKAIAGTGFDFVYYTTDWFWSKSYAKYKNRLKELRTTAVRTKTKGSNL